MKSGVCDVQTHNMQLNKYRIYHIYDKASILVPDKKDACSVYPLKVFFKQHIANINMYPFQS